MFKKKIIFLSVGILFVVATLVVTIAAWLTDTDSTDETEFTIGDVTFVFEGSLIETNDPIVPGQQLVAEDGINGIKLLNKSTVSTELRVLVTVTVDGITVTDLSSIFTTGSIGDGFSLASGWTLNEDGYWYYSVSGSSVITTSVKEIALLSSLKLDGSKVGNDYATKLLTIQFTFQAKQAEYVTWAELGSIDFDLGIQKPNN